MKVYVLTFYRQLSNHIFDNESKALKKLEELNKEFGYNSKNTPFNVYEREVK